MPIDQHNLIKASKVDEDVFACLYQSPQAGICMLHLLKSDGSTVNTENAGFEMRNLTWNLNQPEVNKADGAGDDVVYFVVLETQQYSLLLHGKEVWTFGEAPNMDTGLSAAAEVRWYDGGNMYISLMHCVLFRQSAKLHGMVSLLLCKSALTLRLRLAATYPRSIRITLSRSTHPHRTSRSPF